MPPHPLAPANAPDLCARLSGANDTPSDVTRHAGFSSVGRFGGIAARSMKCPRLLDLDAIRMMDDRRHVREPIRRAGCHLLWLIGGKWPAEATRTHFSKPVETSARALKQSP